MTSPHEPSGTPPSPQLADLLARYLHNQAAAHEAGLAFADPTGAVVPHEAVPAQPVDPRLAWNDALAVLPYYAAGAQAGSCQPPPDWPVLVASHEPVVALAFCVGNFPQLVRNLQPLLHAKDLSALRSTPVHPVSVSGLLDWAVQKRPFPQTLLALGTLRLARQFDQAAELIERQRAEVPAEWQAAWANEEAALAWHQGRADEAVVLWQAQPASVPVLFNRGMAALFLGKPADARSLLNRAAEQLPEASAWHHLGRLYLALAEMRG